MFLFSYEFRFKSWKLANFSQGQQVMGFPWGVISLGVLLSGAQQWDAKGPVIWFSSYLSGEHRSVRCSSLRRLERCDPHPKPSWEGALLLSVVLWLLIMPAAHLRSQICAKILSPSGGSWLWESRHDPKGHAVGLALKFSTPLAVDAVESQRQAVVPTQASAAQVQSVLLPLMAS